MGNIEKKIDGSLKRNEDTSILHAEFFTNYVILKFMNKKFSNAFQTTCLYGPRTSADFTVVEQYKKAVENFKESVKKLDLGIPDFVLEYPKYNNFSIDAYNDIKSQIDEYLKLTKDKLTESIKNDKGYSYSIWEY